jgi:LPS O-antigen subunit length determinant protein (WzzB/FepE family)
MTLDERIQFLVQSSESLHATVHEMTGQLQEQTKQLQEHTKQLELDAQNIRSLANIAGAHQMRLDQIDGLTP